MTSFLIRNAEIGTQTACVRVKRGQIAAMGPHLEPDAGDQVVEADGGRLLPGLRDHHIHLLALTAARLSVRCGPPQVKNRAALAQALQKAADRVDSPTALRGVGYHESVAGPLDRAGLDAMLATHPVRIQHRSGALWILNSLALAQLNLEGEPSPKGVERDASGRPTGRIFREDAWLRAQLDSPRRPDLSDVGTLLASYGVTGVCDATPTNTADELALFSQARRAGALPQKLLLMGGAQLPAETGDLHLERGAVKYMLDENALPDEAELIEIIRSAHASNRGVAFHCVTRSELVVALNAFERAGPNPLDRIEHASVTPPDLLAWMTQLSVAVITQPNFLRERGDAYLENVDARDQPWLYRCAGFLKAGVPLAAGTDAPFGEPDPWAAMQAAVERRSAAGQPLGLDEALSPEQALGLFQSPLQQPGRGQAQISLGAPADLVLLSCNWTRARDRLVAEDVRATWVNGQKVWQRDA